MSKRIQSFVWTALLLVSSVMPAAAQINCEDGYQIVHGERIATPYCGDQLLARLSRRHGVSASADAIRKSPQLKTELCGLAGNDPSLQSICASSLP